jgi:hypothetical protein
MISNFLFRNIAFKSIGLVILFFLFIACSGEANYTPPDASTDIAITHYSFGKITVDGKVYEHDIAISQGKEVINWRAKINHAIQLNDITPFLDESTKSVIIGIGADKNCTVTDDVGDFLKSKGVDLWILDTFEAVKLFNKLPKEGLSAVFHINC